MAQQQQQSNNNNNNVPLPPSTKLDLDAPVLEFFANPAFYRNTKFRDLAIESLMTDLLGGNMSSSSSRNNDDKKEAPELEFDAPAMEFFAKDAFYRNSKYRELALDEMRAELQGKTVQAVFQGFQNSTEATTFFGGLGIDLTWIECYYDIVSSSNPQSI